MKQHVLNSVTKWLTTVLLSIWGVSLFLFATETMLPWWILLPVLVLWTAAIALLDTVAGGGAVALLMTAAVVIPFVLLDGAPVVSGTVALLTGGTVETAVVLYAVIFMGFAVFSVLALYLMRHFWPRAAWCAVWLALWIWASVCEWGIPKMTLAAGGGLMLMTLVEALHLRRPEWREHGTLRRWTTVWMAGAALVLLVLPVSSEPYSYPVLNAIREQVEEVCDDLVTEIFFREDGEGEFTMGLAGYAEDGAVGDGMLVQGERSGVRVRSMRTLDGSLYLVGNTWDSFDGRGWSATLSGSKEDLLDWNMDTAERIYALWRYQQRGDAMSVTNYMRTNVVSVWYDGVDTRTLFMSPNTVRITANRERFPWEALPGKVLFDYLQTRDVFYQVHWLEQNDARIEEILNDVEGYAYGTDPELTWLTVFGDYYSEFSLTRAVFDTDDRIEPLMLRRQEEIYDAYLGIPEDVSDEVRALAEEITAGCGSDYEKLVAIARYLQTNYRYTTEPDPVSEGRPFLDHVLFETEEGYCTWYATAATMLARCVGIPARYVQGYCVELEAGEMKQLEEADSHSWCEGYVAGFGWVTVEATPGYRTAGIGWDTVFDEPETEPPVPEEEVTEEADVPEEDDQALRMDGGAVVGVIPVLALAAAAVMLPGRWKERRRYRSASWSGKAKMDLERFLSAPVRRDLRRRGDETLRAYFNRLRWMLRLDVIMMEQRVVFYEELLFGERELTEEAWRESRDFLQKLHRMRSRRGSGSE